MNSLSLLDYYNSLYRTGSQYTHQSIVLTKKRGKHPLNSFFLLGNKKNHSIINPDKSLVFLLETFTLFANFLLKEEKKGKKEYNILLVSTNPEFTFFIEDFCKNIKLRKKCSLFFCSEKLVGGLLSNWRVVSKSVSIFNNFYSEYGDFLKRNSIYFPRFKKLERYFSGLKPVLTNPQPQNHPCGQGRSPSPSPLTTYSKTRIGEPGIKKNFKDLQGFYQEKKEPSILKRNRDNEKFLPFKDKPDFIICINPKENENLIRESNSLRIPVIAILSSNTNPSGITYPVPGNSDSVLFVYFFLRQIIKIINNPEKLKTWL